MVSGQLHALATLSQTKNPSVLMFISFLMVCVRENFKLCSLCSQMQKPILAKLNVCKIINLKLFFGNIVIVIATKIVLACFNEKGNGKDNKK